MGIKYRGYENVHVKTRECCDKFQIDDIITSIGNKGTVVDVKVSSVGFNLYVSVFYVPFKEVADLTLDAAIKHAHVMSTKLCGTSCGNEHRQLADWLTELKQHKRFVDWLHNHLESKFRDYGCDYQMNNRLADIVKDFVNGKNRDF